MATDGDSLPLQPRQFRLRTVFGVITFCCVVLAVVRLLPEPPQLSPGSTIVGLILLGMITGFVYLVARNIDGPGPLFAGCIGTLCGGSAFGVLTVAYFGPKFDELGFMFLAMLVGVFWAGLYLIGGLFCALIWYAVRRRADVWSGVICGTATGFLTLVTTVADQHEARFIAFFPALVGGIYGGFASAVQIHHAELRRRKRLASMAAVLDLNAVTLPSTSESPPSAI